MDVLFGRIINNNEKSFTIFLNLVKTEIFHYLSDRKLKYNGNFNSRRR